MQMYVPALVDNLLPALARHKDCAGNSAPEAVQNGRGIAGGVASTIHSLWFKIFQVIQKRSPK